MHDDITPPSTEEDDDQHGRYRTIDFADGLLIFDREATAGWVHSDAAISLRNAR